MDFHVPELGPPSRLRALLDHFAVIEDPRRQHRVAYPLSEIRLLAVCGTIVDCDDDDAIALWGEEHLAYLRGFLPFQHGVPGGRWLTIMMNRINPALFSACLAAWVRDCWPDRPELIAVDGTTSRRSGDKAAGQSPLHLVSAFATTSRLVLAREAVPDKANELAAIPVLLDRLAVDDGLKGAIVTIDAIACNATGAQAFKDAGADYVLAVKANQPTLRGEIAALFDDHATQVDRTHDIVSTVGRPKRFMVGSTDSRRHQRRLACRHGSGHPPQGAAICVAAPMMPLCREQSIFLVVSGGAWAARVGHGAPQVLPRPMRRSPPRRAASRERLQRSRRSRHGNR